MKSKKDKLFDVLKKPFGKYILIDIDQTIAAGTYWVGNKKHPQVDPLMRDIIYYLDNQGAHIVIWTARPLKAMIETYKWLGQNNLQYPLACRLKPACDLMIDDKALNVLDVISFLKDKIYENNGRSSHNGRNKNRISSKVARR